MTEPLATGVIGVGSMGRNHARVYSELQAADLVGVADADAERASEVADSYDTAALTPDALLEAADAVSIAVPTKHHYETARECIERGVHILVEKPFVDRPVHGRQLIEQAQAADVTLQVGHVERFNPAVRTLAKIVPDLEILAVDATRLGPPIDRDVDVSPVLDLMIHDIDVLRSIVGGDVTGVSATAADGDPYVAASVRFEDGVVGTLTASRVTQQKVRTLSITARDCRVVVDYIDQSVEIHRQSLPEWIERDGDVRYRHQDVVEQPTVENGEPLEAELSSFLEAVETGDEPVVTGTDGLEAVRLANRITDAATEESNRPLAEVSP